MVNSPSWLAESCDQVLRRAREEIASRATRSAQGEAMLRALDASRCARSPHRYHASIHLPLLVHAAIRGEDEPAVPLAAACTLVWSGAELYDGLTDGHLPESWRDASPSEVVFAATAIGCVLPPAILADLEVTAERRVSMVGALEAGLLRTFDGQQRDLAYTGAREPAPDEVEASVVGKNGVPKSLFAGLAADMAGAAPEIREAYRRYALGLGVIYQLQSDRYEMFSAPRCRDLEQGTRTLHIALFMDALPEDEREEFVALLDLARTDPEAHREVRRRLRRTDVVRAWLAVVSRWAAEAESFLAVAAPEEPAGSVLRNLVRARSPRCG